jgi:iron complex outermembrane receptor protein
MIRILLLTTVALCASNAQGQTVSPAPSSDHEIVVTGTRAQGRAALESSAPIDVIDGEEMGLVNDHAMGCAFRERVAQTRSNFSRPQ